MDKLVSGLPTGIERHAIFERTPIIERHAIFERTPVVVREPIFWAEKLDWDTVYDKLDNYIKFAAKQVSSNSLSSVISAEDLYQEGLLLLWECFDKYKHKPQSEFETIFKTSLWRKVRGLAYKPEFLGVELDTAYDLGYDEDTIANLYENFKLQEVVSMISSNQIALNILKEILYPSSRTIWEINVDIARKETLRSLGHKVHVPQQVEVSAKILQRSLGLTEREYLDNMALIKDSVYQVYSKDVEIKSYDPCTYSDLLSEDEASDLIKQIQDTIQRLVA